MLFRQLLEIDFKELELAATLVFLLGVGQEMGEAGMERAPVRTRSWLICRLAFANWHDRFLINQTLAQFSL